MLFLKHRPVAPLSEFAEYLWLLSDAPSHSKECILPSGTLELVVNLREDEIRIYDEVDVCRKLSGMVISGAYRRPFVIDTAEHALVMGAHFRPGGALPFTRVAPGELADCHVNVQELWGFSAREIRERLCTAATHQERFQIFERALLERVHADLKRRAVVRFALEAFEKCGVSVREIVQSVGLSHRHFTSVFREQVGMTPKLFLRVQRFQRAVVLAQRPRAVDWAALASECGYYDQAHLSGDFTSFAGFTPGDYLRHRSDGVKDHHVALS